MHPVLLILKDVIKGDSIKLLLLVTETNVLYAVGELVHLAKLLTSTFASMRLNDALNCVLLLTVVFVVKQRSLFTQCLL